MTIHIGQLSYYISCSNINYILEKYSKYSPYWTFIAREEIYGGSWGWGMCSLNFDEDLTKIEMIIIEYGFIRNG